MRAVITSNQFMTEGGCNACLPFELETFNMQLEGRREVSLENFDISSIVMPIVQADGWKTTMLFDEEGILFAKAGQEVAMIDTFDGTIFRLNEQKKACSKKECEEALFATVNEVLAVFFDIAPITFEVKQG